jgi:hypothetical protein
MHSEDYMQGGNVIAFADRQTGRINCRIVLKVLSKVFARIEGLKR